MDKKEKQKTKHGGVNRREFMKKSAMAVKWCQRETTS